MSGQVALRHAETTLAAGLRRLELSAAVQDGHSALGQARRDRANLDIWISEVNDDRVRQASWAADGLGGRRFRSRQALTEMPEESPTAVPRSARCREAARNRRLQLRHSS